ncbi:hypothetical protein EST38_g3559 [Candolleomyces aberdarensis]|uniref:Uncharacterized protein n=1 Tax=Candolleomyces aberdarensis TaxID=2316362 RepID=A0A4Q2DTS5_9AGAR|nr:hypothetical protein EST38_g3559 [Candolleomyces aberdarensis]
MAEPNSEEKVIVVVGDTGMGKSSFINSVIGSEVAAVDDTLFTCTREVKGHKYKRDGLEVTLVDTPGFRYFVEGDDKSDEKIVKMIDEFLKQQAGKRASGIFFLHSIAGNAPEISDKAMRTLKRLCGNSLSKYAAVVVTTRWDEVGDEPDSDWESPEAALTNKDGLLKELNDIGVPFYRTAHSKDLDLEHLGKELLSPATIVELFLTRRQESSDSEDKDPKAEDTLSKPEPAFTQQDSTQPVACPEADPEERDIISFEERPSPGVPERNLDADHEVPPPALTPPIVQPTVVPSSFGENVDRLGAIRSILDNYPFSAGLLREILQNSDDAEATEQTFLLDCRRHPSERIYHPSLANTQGPALLASNNAKFAPEDWTALQNISRSSKREDTSKIGKFGIGIRSCYHVTDYLQILSGGVLVIFDPQSSFSEGGGARFSVTPETVEPICDHLQSFGHFLPLNWNGEAFNGTVVRMPLRTEPGEIGKIVSPETIQQLFKEFIQRELSIAMLFLQHLRSIEFAIIDEGGRVTKMAHCTVKIAGPLSEGVYKQTVCVQRAEEASAKDEEWLVVHRSFVKDEVLQLLSTRAGPPCESVLKKHKLRADVGLAFPLSHPQNIEPDIGQLFTFLRLPIKTRFPAHIHSLFSLTSSRQNLRPHGENGIVKGFDDYTLIEWNKLLFDVFIPRAWTHLLRTLPKHAPTTPHFSAWPVTQHFTESDSAYWGSFPENVLDTVLEEEDATIWPVTGQDVCKRLQDVLLARPSTSDEVIKALADTGMSICRPPDHLFRMMEALPGWNHRILTPERASTELRVNFASNLLNAPDERRATILQYLLSSFVSLAHRGTTSDIHTLLESSDVKVFRLCDGNAISLGDLPPSAVDLFRQEAPRTLNVKPLDPDQVVRYLALHPTRRDLSMKLSKTEADGAAVTLLTSFWVWFDSWGSRSSLLPKLEDEYVLPCAGGLRRAIRSQPVFDAAGIPALSACLSGFGVPFLSNALGSGARNVLAKYGFLKSTTDMHVLLDAMGTFAGSVSNQNVQLLFSHFNQYMVNSTTDSFSKKQKTAFRRLPIFPIVEYDPDTSVRCRRAAVNGLVVYGVRSFELLPELPNTVFVDVNVLDPRLLPPLNEAQPGPMSDMEVVGLSIKSLDSQPKTLLAHMLQHVASDQQYLTPGLEESLRSEKYAYSSLGTREAPQTLIDPSSPLYSLYANDGQRLHSLQDEEERSIADSLARLGLLDKALSENNIMDRILHISSTVSLNDAVKLMNIIYQYGFNCCTLTLDKSVKWLPTQKESLATAAECRPAGGTSSEELHLFDKVLELVHPSAMVSPSLRTVLGWDDPIPVDVLLRQFRDVLDNPEADVYHRVKNLIKELSRRRQSLTAAQWSSLRELLENRRWVPTSEYTLVESWQAVFSSPFQGIYMLAPDLSRMGSDSQNFLTNLGCLPIPSFATVARRFSQLTDESPSATVTSSAIATLKFAVSLTLSEDERSQLLVPDDLHRLQHIQDVLFNDVGPNSLLLPPNEVCLANSSIDDTLARALELKRLGLEHVHLQKIGEDMGITLATIVQKTLAQYTDKQFLLEFLANAQDAGASKFMVILNDYISVEGNFLSLDLAKLHDSPSVMVYNDSEFSESDFEGICKTHIGSKVDNPDSIGQFGLGALTMFHITECAVIYSGHKVLFLDPSKSYLPIAGRASLLMPLKDLNRLYPGHTNYLRGLDFFEPQECRVNGTIFFLPLRSSSSTPQSKKPLFSTDYSINTFQQAILRDFHDKADECLLFIQVKDIEAQLRTSAQSNSPEPFWSFNASREETAFDGITVTKISINSCATSGEKTSSKWLTMSTAFQASDVPQECRAGVGSKTAKVGLAAPLGEEPRAQSKFFSMLPLATSTALPVHVNASFRLSADRRQIRLDSYDNDTLFNRWLLEMQLPPLYLALLERIAQEHDNTRWWPGAREDVSPPADRGEDDIVTTHEHVPTAIILESFYSKHLPKSSRSIFYSMYSGESLRQSDVILYPTYSQTSIASPAPIPSSVQRVIDILEPKNVTKPTAPVSTRLEKVGLPEVLGPNFIRKLLLTNGGAELIQKELSKEDLVALLAWLVGEGKRTDYLEGLPLLLLQNESWGVFETKGQTFYSSPESPLFVEEDFLPSDLFVHPATMPKKLSEILLTSALSISRLDGVVLQRLVKERLDGLESQARAPWVDRFWKVYPKFPKDGLPKSIERLSLIPTMSGTFKTLIDCRDSGFLNDDSDSERLVEFFQDLGIDVIPVKRFPSELQVVLQSREYDLRGTLFSRFLRCVSPIIESAVKKFLEWPSPRQDEFAGWVREAIRTNVDAKYVQRVVAQEEPLERLLVAFPEFGTPSVKEVVAHLGELCRLPHGSTVLHDLKATYQWLTKNSPAVVSFADQLKDEPIFLNVNNPEIDEWIWSSASQMAFEVSDLTNIQGVRDFLKPYDRFLKAAGVVETYYPKLDEDNEHSGDSYDLKLFRSLRANLNEQRLGGNFTDVLFLPQKEASGLTREKLYLLDHPSLRGHRGYLASCTPWFKKVFLEASQKGVGWSEDGIVYLADDGGTAVDIEEDTTKEEGGESIEDTTAESLTTTNDFPNMQIVLLPKSRNAIMAVLDYFYTDQPFPREETSLEDLLQTLELSHYLDVKALFVLSQREMVRRKLVNAETLEEVQRRSQHLDAGIINKWCNDYKEANSKLFGLISRQTVRQFFNGLLAIRG